MQYACGAEPRLIVGSVSPLRVAMAPGFRLYLGICLPCQARGELREDSTEPDDRQPWSDRGAVEVRDHACQGAPARFTTGLSDSRIECR